MMSTLDQGAGKDRDRLRVPRFRVQGRGSPIQLPNSPVDEVDDIVGRQCQEVAEHKTPVMARRVLAGHETVHTVINVPSV